MLFLRILLEVTFFLSLIYHGYRTYLQIRVASLVAAGNGEDLELPRHVDPHWTGVGSADVDPPPAYKA